MMGQKLWSVEPLREPAIWKVESLHAFCRLTLEHCVSQSQLTWVVDCLQTMTSPAQIESDPGEAGGFLGGSENTHICLRFTADSWMMTLGEVFLICLCRGLKYYED